VKRRILFVDDNIKVLEALRNRLRRRRRLWDMVFVEDGSKALDACAEQPFDVVVADMRMPAMNGVELLGEVMRLYPATARIMLTGHVNEKNKLAAMRVTHRFLDKPCSPAQLDKTVERCCTLTQLLDDAALRKVVGGMDSIPSVPKNYWALNEALEDPEVELGQIAGIIERDLAMNARVLQIVNSAYFGLSRTITRVRDAVSFLGLQTLRTIASCAVVFEAVAETKMASGFSLEQLSDHSLLVRDVAKQLPVDKLQKGLVETAAMLHDIGHLLMATRMPRSFKRVRAHAAEKQISVAEAEYALMGVSHAEIGAYLLGLWGLPPAIVEAVAHHHRPERIEHESLDLVVAVHVADLLARQEQTQMVGDRQQATAAADRARAPSPLLATLELGDQLPSWRAIAQRAVQRMSA